MPEFPRHDSSRSLTTDQPRAFRDDADIRTDAAANNKIASNAIDSVTDTTMKWNAAVEQVQTDTMMYNMKLGVQEAANAAAEDPNLDSEQTYLKKVQDLRKQVTKGVSISVANRAAAELDYVAAMGTVGIQSEYRKKTIIHGQAVSMGELTLITNSAIDPKAGAAAIKLEVDKAVKSGYWNEVEALNKQAYYNKEMKQNIFIKDINADPAKAEQNLLQNSYDFDVQELENAGKVYERELKVIRNQTEELLIDMKSAGTLTEDVIKEQRRIGKIDANFANAQLEDMRKVTIPKVTALESIKQANILATKYNALKDKEWGWKNASFEERTQFRADVYKAHAKGWIDDDLMNAYLDKKKDKLRSDPMFTNAMKYVFDMSKNYGTDDAKEIAKYQMSADLMAKVGNGMAPKAALDAVITDRVAADFPGVDPVDLMFTAKKRGVPIWQVYDLIKGGEKK